ncbi:PRC-barrel domain-containing protein [Limimaricola sp. G21655-S1]|uniref:PRC-barrel domain-containing protein n=1 Tax=Limimaricola sp. G21655-S1 TaxID=3014768 RepID=UPI0022B04664|nr:PRC-barrel domain-containing protein [Limimaricola sp. G21655-S1]MCZ4261719.1 PRC-barrel domain-containing protein [Limimaricola sp. G21655-S1]
MKILLTTAATALVMGTTAYAESHAMGMGSYEVSADDFYASNLMGMRVYSSEQELGENGDPINFTEQQWDDIGEINDLIISEDGSVQAVIVGVGGFLGIGEKDVALTMDQIRTYDDENGERFLVINSSQEALEAAPAFERATAEETAMTEGEAAEPGMVEQTDAAAATAAATATMAEGEAEMETEAEAETEMVEGEAEMETMEAEVETEMAEGEAEMEAMETEVETEMAEGEAEMEAMEAEVETEMAEGEAEMEAMETEVETEMAEGEAEMTETAPVAGATGMVDREGYTTAAVSDLSTDELNGATVYGADDDNIGEIEDLVASDSGEITEAVIGVGGFLGIGEKKVAVNFEDLQILTNEDGSDIRVYISATEDELKALPAYEAPEEAAMDAGMETETEMEVETETAPAAQ